MTCFSNNGGGLSSTSALEDRWSHAFMLVHVQNLNVYTFFARSLEAKEKWIASIKQAMDNAFPNQRLASTHEAVMHTFQNADTSCAHCGKLLKGLFYQGESNGIFTID